MAAAAIPAAGVAPQRDLAGRCRELVGPDRPDHPASASSLTDGTSLGPERAELAAADRSSGRSRSGGSLDASERAASLTLIAGSHRDNRGPA